MCGNCSVTLLSYNMTSGENVSTVFFATYSGDEGDLDTSDSFFAWRSSDCDYNAYLNRYADLKSAYGTNVGSAEQHWTQEGQYEGRDCTGIYTTKPTHTNTTWQEVSTYRGDLTQMRTAWDSANADVVFDLSLFEGVTGPWNHSVISQGPDGVVFNASKKVTGGSNYEELGWSAENEFKYTYSDSNSEPSPFLWTDAPDTATWEAEVTVTLNPGENSKYLYGTGCAANARYVDVSSYDACKAYQEVAGWGGWHGVGSWSNYRAGCQVNPSNSHVMWNAHTSPTSVQAAYVPVCVTTDGSLGEGQCSRHRFEVRRERLED